MILTQLIYLSRRTPALGMEEFQRIVTASAYNNLKLHVTGALLCCGESVMQVLEGDGPVLEELFARISADPRHTHVQVLVRKAIRKRMFPEWGMVLAQLDRKFKLDRTRLTRLLDDIRAAADTSHHSVEARIVLNEFQQQLIAA